MDDVGRCNQPAADELVHRGLGSALSRKASDHVCVCVAHETRPSFP